MRAIPLPSSCPLQSFPAARGAATLIDAAISKDRPLETREVGCFPALTELWTSIRFFFTNHFGSMSVDEVNALSLERLAQLKPRIINNLSRNECARPDPQALNRLSDEAIAKLDARVLNDLSDTALGQLDARVLNKLADKALRQLLMRVPNGLSDREAGKLDARVLNESSYCSQLEYRSYEYISIHTGGFLRKFSAKALGNLDKNAGYALNRMLERPLAWIGVLELNKLSKEALATLGEHVINRLSDEDLAQLDARVLNCLVPRRHAYDYIFTNSDRPLLELDARVLNALHPRAFAALEGQFINRLPDKTLRSLDPLIDHAPTLPKAWPSDTIAKLDRCVWDNLGREVYNDRSAARQ